jgi:hypothetical protein
MRFLGDGTSCAMAAEIDDLDIMVPASCLDGENVLVSPTPEFDMPKTSRGNARNFLFCEQAADWTFGQRPKSLLLAAAASLFTFRPLTTMPQDPSMVFGYCEPKTLHSSRDCRDSRSVSLR